MGRGLFVAVGVMAVTVVAPDARGDTDSASKADRLFKEGMALLHKGQNPEACAKLEESDRLERALGTEYNLAACLELTHKIASARRMYLRASQLGLEGSKTSIAKDAVVRAKKLEPIVPRLALEIPRDVTGVIVRCDDREVPETEWAEPLELDPGPHRVTATANNRAPFDKTVDLHEGQRARLPISFGLVDAPKPITPPKPEEPHGLHTLQYVGIGVGAAGVVALGAGIFFTVEAGSTRDASGCKDGRVCPDANAADQLRHAGTQADVATILYVTGGILAAGGAALFVFGPPLESERTGLPSARITPLPGGASFDMRF